MKRIYSTVLFMIIVQAWAQSVPPLINYQGRLANVDGTPFPTADYVLAVNVYDAPAGGNRVWGPQIFDGEVGMGRGPKISVVQGYFNATLGPFDTNGASLAKAFEGTSRYVEVSVNQRPPVAPRQQMTSAPYAMASENGSPPGSVTAFAGPTNTIPAGWLLCDGSAVTTNQYFRLFRAIGRSWGEGNGGENSFSLPDMRGLFLRGADGTRGLDPDSLSRVTSGTNGSSGNEVGSFQSDELRSHQHQWAGIGVGNLTLSRFLGMAVLSWGQATDPSTGEQRGSAFDPGDNAGSIRPSGGAESRPKNVYVNYIIKY